MKYISRHPKQRHGRHGQNARNAQNTQQKTRPFAILLILFCTLLTSSGQLLLKIGTNRLQLSVPAIVQNWPLLLGLVLYGASAIVMIIALKYGELSILYPFIALSFIWVMILSIFFLQESVSLWNWSGVAAILLGVSLIGKGGSVKA